MLEMITGKEPFSTTKTTNDLVFQIFQLIGTPNERVWPGVTKLQYWKKYDKWPKMDGKLTDFLKATNATPEEIHLLQHILTWKDQRFTALQILRNPYFDEVRTMISSPFPAQTIRRFNCGEWMLQIQVAIPSTAGRTINDTEERITSFNWLVMLVKKIGLNTKASFMAQWIYNMYGSIAGEIETWNLGLLIITSVLLGSKIRGDKAPQIKILEDLAENQYSSANIIAMEERILQTLDFNLVVPLSIDFVHYLLGNNTKKVMPFVNNTLLLLMTNYNWVVLYGQYGLARTAVDLAMKRYKLTPEVCVRMLPKTKTIPGSEINQFLTTNWDLLINHSTYRMIANTLRSLIG